MSSWLWDIAGMPAEQYEHLEDLTTGYPQLVEALIGHAYRFLSSGLRPAEYLALSSIERAIVIVAAQRLVVENAKRIGIAAQPTVGPALAQSELDGGEEVDQLLLSKTCDRLIVEGFRNG